MMDERGVIDVERNFADTGECIFALLVVENAHIFGDQTAKRIEREAADGGFHAALVQFFDDAITPLSAKAFFRKVPSAAKQGGKCNHGHEAPHADYESARKSRLSILRARGDCGRFENREHSLTATRCVCDFKL